MIAARIVGLAFVFLAAGCAGLQRSEPGEPPQTGAMQSGSIAVEPVIYPTTSTHEQPKIGATQGGAAAIEPMVPPAAPPLSRATGQPAAKAQSSIAKTPAKVPASTVPTEQVRKKESVAQGHAKQETPPPLDLISLETRLKETNAIGVFTKITLKNQVDDLLNQFRAFYQGRLKTTLAELRRPYDLLLLKVLALLQDADPPLAGEIAASREAIWGILADQAKFTTI